MKIGCSNTEIVFKLIGAPPLFGGLLGLYKLAHGMDVKFSLLLQSLLFIIFGLFATGYRSCLFLFDNCVVIEKRQFYFFKKKVQIEYSNFDDIFVDILHKVSIYSSTNALVYYAIYLRGAEVSVSFIDYLWMNTSVWNRKSWGKITELTKKVAMITGLPITYSEKIKSMHQI